MSCAVGNPIHTVNTFSIITSSKMWCQHGKCNNVSIEIHFSGLFPLFDAIVSNDKECIRSHRPLSLRLAKQVRTNFKIVHWFIEFINVFTWNYNEQAITLIATSNIKNEHRKIENFIDTFFATRSFNIYNCTL